MFPNATGIALLLEARHKPRRNFFMRSLVGLLVCAALFFVVYQIFLKKMPATDQGTASTQAITLIGVRSDLLRIAEAERAYIAINGHCTPLDELMSSGSLSMTRSERDGYSYSVECFGGEFTAAAHHSPAPASSPIRYPNFAVDATMQIHEID